MTRRRRTERGTALTEVALLLPLFVVLIYGSVHLAELGIYKLRAQEIARFGAFATASQPLSSFDDFNHSQKFEQASTRVRDELTSVYRDLDGAREHLLATSGASGKTMSALYAPPAASDLRNRTADALPTWASVEWAEVLSLEGLLFSALGIGTGSDSLVAGMTQRVGMNNRGLISSRANITILPPWRASDAATARAMAGAGALRGASLSRWLASGQQLRDEDGRPIEVTLLADPWRVEEGFSAIPSAGEHAFAKAVARVNERAVSALPAGPLVSAILSVLSVTEKLPSEATQFLGWQQGSIAAELFARPYTERRAEHPNFNGTVERGQVDIFASTGGKSEGGAVTNFETLPLYTDPKQPHASGYLKALNARGRNFMGCPQSEDRGCWE